MSLSRIKLLILRAARYLPRSIAARLYWVGGLTLGTVVVLAFGSLLYVQRTTQVVTVIRDHDVALSSALADVELLLERHRRIIESAPAQLDRRAINRNRGVSEAIAQRIGDLVKSANDPLLATVKNNLEPFVLSGRRVLSLAANFAQSEALAAVKIYDQSAKKIQTAVRLSRASSVAATEGRISDLVARGQRLNNWVTAAAMLALLIVLPVSVVMISGVAHRIKTITDSMRRVALGGIPVSAAAQQPVDDIAEMAHALAIFERNATTLMSNTNEIEKLNTWFHIALNNMARGLSMFDVKGRLLVCNQRYLELYGLPDLLGRPGTSFEAIADYWHCINGDGLAESRTEMVAWIARLRGHLRTGKPFTEIHEIDGGRTVSVSTQPLAGGGWVDLHEDITDKLAAETEISRLAHFDTLTGLANRHYFQETLDEALCSTPSGRRFAVLWFDLDKFKAVNDTLGHPAGDALLKIVADRLRATVRSGDFIARLGGDEFAIIASGGGMTETEAATLAKRVLGRISAPYDINGKMISVGVSIGIAIAPDHGCTAEELTRNADIALYRAKSRGRGNYVLFGDNLEAEITVREKAETDLRRALAASELLLHYQPILEFDDGPRKILRSVDALATSGPRHGLAGRVYTACRRYRADRRDGRMGVAPGLPRRQPLARRHKSVRQHRRYPIHNLGRGDCG